jgi:anti-sigma factor RsiW
MNEMEFEKLRETAWRRPLTPAEEARARAWLEALPEAQAAWEADTALSRGLARLPDAPVASNFTAQVLQALDREEAQAARRPASWLERARGWFTPISPRWAWAGLVVAALWFGVWQQQQASMRTETARGLAAFSAVSAVVQPAALADFDAVMRLEQAPPSTDDELFAVLNQ